MNSITPHGPGAWGDPRQGGAIATQPSGGALAVGQAAVGEQRMELSVSDLWLTIMKWRWLILGAALAGAIIAVVITFLTTPLYRAVATIEINREPTQIMKGSEVEPMRGGDREFLGTQIGLLSSRSLAERVARQLNLGKGGNGASKAREGQAVGRVAGGLTVEAVRDSRLVKISFVDPDPAIAARVANGFADNFIAQNLERRYETTAYARDFLQKRIATVKQRLEQSERQLVDYAKQEGIIELPSADGKGSGGSLNSASLVALNEALSVAQTQRIEAEQRFRQAGGSSARAASVNNGAIQGLRTDLAKLESQYQENLNVYKPDYPAMVRLQQQIASLRATINRESSSVSGAVSGELAGAYRAAVAREAQLRGQVNQLKSGALDLRDRSIQYTILQREVDTNRSLYDGLLQRFKEVGIAGGVGANLVSIVDRAQVPGGPFKPRRLVNLLIGLFAGLGLGLVAAFGRELISDKIETAEELEQKLGLRALGIIPRIASKERFVNLIGDPRSALYEAYQSAMTALRFATSEGIPKTMLITSSRPSEGKSSTSLALAQAFARLGHSVVLIDADMRMPTFMPVEEDAIGLSNLLTGERSIERAVFSAKLDNLYFLSSGPIPPNPAELLAGDRFREILDELGTHFDLILIDGPPVLGLADAPLLGSAVKAVVMIIESGNVRRRVAMTALARLRGSQSNVIGAILTKSLARRAGYGGYDYGYGYGYGNYQYGQDGDARDGNAGRRLIDLNSQ